MAHLKFRTYSIAIAFLSVISFPFVNDHFHFLGDIKSFENRQAKNEPPLDIKHLDNYPQPYDAYYNDHFTLRSLIVKFHSFIKVVVFHQSPVPDKVIIGNDGWLFSSGEEFDSYMGRKLFSREELEAFSKELDHRKKYLEKSGCKLYLLIAPGKAVIYSQFISLQFTPASKYNWGEQLIAYLDKNCTVKPVNVYNALRARAGNEMLFYKLDNHWNQLGAFYSANEVIKVMSRDFKELDTLSLSDFKVVKEELATGNMQKMMGDLDMFKDYEINLEPKSGYKAVDTAKMNYPSVPGFAYPFEYEFDKVIKGSKKPRILIISDSFGKAIFPFLAENFSRSVKIFDAWQYKLNEEIVENEKPDAVLLLINEPILRNFLNFQSRLSKK